MGMQQPHSSPRAGPRRAGYERAHDKLTAWAHSQRQARAAGSGPAQAGRSSQAQARPRPGPTAAPWQPAPQRPRFAPNGHREVNACVGFAACTTCTAAQQQRPELCLAARRAGGEEKRRAWDEGDKQGGNREETNSGALWQAQRSHTASRPRADTPPGHCRPTSVSWQAHAGRATGGPTARSRRALTASGGRNGRPRTGASRA